MRARILGLGIVVLIVAAALVVILRRGAHDDADASARPASAAPRPAPSAPAPPLPRRATHWPVVIVGVDGMDWRIADPLLKAGRLPNLAKLIERGARAELRSAEPMLSPLLWNTMATGRRPEDHGICDFLAIVPSTGARVPIPSTLRRTPALWNIAGEAGIDSGFVAWWATWPAEPVRGVMVSDRLAYTLADAGAAPADGLAFPPAFQREALALRVSPDAVDARLVASFIKGEARDAERVAHLRRMISGALTYHAVGMKLLERGDLPLVGLYYELIDQVGHRFMHLAPPRRADVDAADFAACSGAVDAGYEMQDRLLGDVVAKSPADAVIIVVSDHGFLSGAERPAGTPDVAGQPGRWHRLFGTFAAAGPPVPAGADLGVVGVEDIAPTVLHLLGLPVAKDMPGRARLATDQQVAAIASYDPVVRLPRRDGPLPAGSEQLDAAALEELQALGYVGTQAPPTKGPAQEGLATTANYHLNAGLSLMSAGRVEDALAQARAALEREPLSDAWDLVSRALEEKRDMDGAIDAARKAASLAPDMPEAQLRLVDLLVRSGRGEQAKEVASRLPAGEGASAASLTARASALASAGDRAGAEGFLRQALRIDPTFAPAVAALLPLAQASGTIGDLEPLLRAALSRNPGLPVHREALGALELVSGRPDAAVKDLRLALQIDPSAHVARARLALALMMTGDVRSAVEEARLVREADPKAAEAWVMIGTVLGRGGELQDALGCLTRARALGASGPSLDVAEAVTRVQLGDGAGAVRVVREGLARHPDDPTLREIAAELERQHVGGK